MSRTIDITPHKSILEKIGRVGFALDEALAEFIDNSLDAKYDPKTGEPILSGKVNVKIQFNNDRIIVEDDSAGILDFDNCLKLAFSEKETDVLLGQFGPGLKTAAMSLGRRITIESKRVGEKMGHKVVLDLDSWNQSDGWLLNVEDFPSDETSHWTRITIEKLLSVGESRTYVKMKLADRFGEFIKEGELSITFNGSEIRPEEREFLDPNSDIQYQRAVQDLGYTDFKPHKEFSFDINGMHITG